MVRKGLTKELMSALLLERWEVVGHRKCRGRACQAEGPTRIKAQRWKWAGVKGDLCGWSTMRKRESSRRWGEEVDMGWTVGAFWSTVRNLDFTLSVARRDVSLLSSWHDLICVFQRSFRLLWKKTTTTTVGRWFRREAASVNDLWVLVGQSQQYL